MAERSRKECKLTRDEDVTSVLELLDRVLNKGVVLDGELVISVADVDLLYLRLSLLLCPAVLANRAVGAHPVPMRNLADAT